ncbi:MAG: restriction endonuclease, partial [Gemmatimonadota bacterium]|nr:restriction endonuclease [Gemmatimonadota bacterium]
MAPEPTLWGIHAGRSGEADALFLKKNVIALGWSKIGDLSALQPSREAFKAAVAAAYPDKKKGAIPGDAGMLFRFRHEIADGDLVVYPRKIDRQIHLGRVTGAYRFDAKADDHYWHHRPVKWIRAMPRTHFSQGALYEIGSALSLFQVRNYAHEFRAAVEGKTVSPLLVGEDETVGMVAEEIEATTRDFILKRFAQDLKGHPFAEFVAHLLNTMGYRTRVSPPGPDSGIDIVAHRDELGFEPPIIKVQVKSTEGSVGNPDAAALYG